MCVFWQTQITHTFWFAFLILYCHLKLLYNQTECVFPGYGPFSAFPPVGHHRPFPPPLPPRPTHYINTRCVLFLHLRCWC